MRVLHKYLAQDYLVTFFMALAIITFVMCMGVVIKAIDLLSRGISILTIVQVFWYNIPYILMFSIPMSSIVSVLLLFGKLSMDGEITAMKASGLNMWGIISSVIMISIVLSFICIYINCMLAPQSHFARRNAFRNVGMEEPTGLLDEGRFIRDFPGLLVYVGRKDKDKVKDVIVYEMGPRGVSRHVRAKRGVLKPDRENHALVVDLYDVRIDQPDKKNPLDPSQSHYITAEHYPVKLDFSDMMKKDKLKKRPSDMTFFELSHAIHHIRETYPQLEERDLLKQRMAMLVEANQRIAMGIGVFALTLMGIPLGMKSRRKESSIGIAISLALIFAYYFFVILAESLVGHPHLRPDLIVWIPVLLFEMIGFVLIRKMN